MFSNNTENSHCQCIYFLHFFHGKIFKRERKFNSKNREKDDSNSIVSLGCQFSYIFLVHRPDQVSFVFLISRWILHFQTLHTFSRQEYEERGETKSCYPYQHSKYFPKLFHLLLH